LKVLEREASRLSGAEANMLAQRESLQAMLDDVVLQVLFSFFDF
jgi:hypothetical protein